jgi:hypothetical protein
VACARSGADERLVARRPIRLRNKLALNRAKRQRLVAKRADRPIATRLLARRAKRLPRREAFWRTIAHNLGESRAPKGEKRAYEVRLRDLPGPTPRSSLTHLGSQAAESAKVSKRRKHS